jgi:nicotinamide phosphoribosyltransferase
VEVLWNIFGGTINEKGYKTLNQSVGLIYGDSITPQRADDILRRLKAKGFASDNVVFGIGSYTYQYLTRDTLGFAMKATYGVVAGKPVEIVKNPITDNGTKKSAKGLLRVEYQDGEFVLYDRQTSEQEVLGELRVIYENGEFYNPISLVEIREALTKS